MRAFCIVSDYGLRARAIQVGCCRLGILTMPISGTPEIGGAPRNDEERDKQ